MSFAIGLFMFFICIGAVIYGLFFDKRACPNGKHEPGGFVISDGSGSGRCAYCGKKLRAIWEEE